MLQSPVENQNIYECKLGSTTQRCLWEGRSEAPAPSSCRWLQAGGGGVGSSKGEAKITLFNCSASLVL